MGADQLHVFLFPLQALGHMIPIRDMAKLFSSRGIKSTIITTPLNAHIFEKSAQNSPEISLRIVKFPTAEAGLPEGCESLDQVTSDALIPNFGKATSLLREPVKKLIQECQPNCLVSDMFFPWTSDVALEFNIPRLVFHGTGFFALCATESMQIYKPFMNVKSDFDDFLVPNFPHEIKLNKKKMAPFDPNKNSDDFVKLLAMIKDSEMRSYGVVVNSFYELEPEYADHYRNVMKMKAWHIGPVSLCNKEVEEKANRGKKLDVKEEDCIEWLDSKAPNSVIYICFGSVAGFTYNQLHEIAMGLEASGHQFIWVVKSNKNGDNEKWMPQGFEERTKGKGLIVRGWAPQLLILDHGSIGGFVTHCGWNSILEGVCSGVPMVTWPVFGEQFYNERFVVDVLRTGVSVGAQDFNRMASEGVKMEAVAKAVKQIMEGEECEGFRRRAEEMKVKARKAVEEGGSSYLDLDDLINDLISYNASRIKD